MTANLYPGGPLTAMLKDLGITYRQFDHWCRRGWVPGMQSQGSGYLRMKGHRESHGLARYYVYDWTPEQTARLKALAEAARIKQMPLDELADALS